MADEVISVHGARVNNLKNVSFSIPIDRLTVVTGVSGSGKSSLAFDTIYAEGQRRYVESLSSYARQFLERMDKPDVDEVAGIPPAIAIRQKNSTRNPRSTVGTQTEVYDYMRLLFARVGTTICRACGRTVKHDSPQSAAQEVLDALEEGTRFYVLFPASAGITRENSVLDKASKRRTPGPLRNGDEPLKGLRGISVPAHVMSLMQRGFTRLYVNGDVVELKSPDDYTGADFAGVYVLVDRLVVRPDILSRLTDSLETCFIEGHGQATIITAGENPRALRFSEHFECKHDGIQYAIPEPRLFSFNNPYGACPLCQGFGNTIGIDFDLVIPNPRLTLAQGAVEPWTKPQYEHYFENLKRFCKTERIPLDIPFDKLTAAQQKAIKMGKGKWRGIRGFFEWLESKKYKLHIRVFIARYRGYTVCPDCGGDRIRQEARDVQVGRRTLPEICALPIKDALEFFNLLELNAEEAAIADKVLGEIRRRLTFMSDVGLGYLSLGRLASTLSGGEAQRIQLATNLGSSLVGTLYVLDEPSIGLHPRDSERLIKLLRNLRDIGNTVLVVEHDADMIKSADHILDVGPAAGELGGRIVFQGSYSRLIQDQRSITAQYLRGEAEIKEPRQRRIPSDQNIAVRGASENNLKGINIDIPLGMLVCITGVSGSGKSTLVHEVIYAGLKKQRGEWQGHVGLFEGVTASSNLEDLILVDQSPIGRTPRSNPVTYIKAFDGIRDLFASTREATARGLGASSFSFNVPGGRCEICQGAGTVTVEMQFLADVELVCEECKGARFKPQVLDVRFRGKNINDVLNLTVREAILFFRDVPRIARRLEVLDEVGLGYLRLGQSATTLSGGEAQRIKLAAHLAKRSGSKSLYIFDEPTTGLHFDDINKLLAAFRSLITSGGSLLVIEHNLDVIKTADYIIDLGPEGGDEGGDVVALGTPDEVMQVKQSYTGQYLKQYVGARAAYAV